MKYRMLLPDEWNRLETIMDMQFAPPPETAGCAVCEDDDGNIVGCLFMQIVMHVEPLVLKNPKVSFAKLYGTLYNAVEVHKGLTFYCFSDKEIVDKMAEHVGMKKMPYRIFKGEVK